MDTNKLLKLLIATNLITLALAGSSVYFAIEARDFADYASAEASSARETASNIEDILRRR